MTAKRLLICFDAFGTLFAPKRPIMEQYADVARSFGLSGFTNEQVGTAFAKAYKRESKEHPNYGHATGLGAEKWWTQIIVDTFRQVIPEFQKLPDQLIPKLLHRFWSKEGYSLYDDVPVLVHRIREYGRRAKQDVMVGVITNSDDRVPDILRSLGLRVALQRFGQSSATSSGSVDVDIDFVIMSYDVGHEKPDRRIFDAATQTVDMIRGSKVDPDAWTKIYVGDEYAKDVVGSIDAGWNAVLVDRTGQQQHPDLIWPESDHSTLFEGFEKSRALGFTTFKSLADSIPV